MLPMLVDYSKRGPYDEIWTPSEALVPLLPYLTFGYYHNKIAWDMCPGEGHLINHLRKSGISVTGEKPEDSMISQPKWYDYIITNPPYSNKHEWLERAVKLDKPFALLMPVTALGTKRVQRLMKDVNVLFLSRRVDFTGGKAPWFAVAWYTKWILDKQMVFQEE